MTEFSLGKHVCKSPRDLEAKEQWLSSKATFARQAAITRRDAPKSGLDQRGLAFLDTLEKEAGINKGTKRKAVSDAIDWRKCWSYEEEMGETVGIPYVCNGLETHRASQVERFGLPAISRTAVWVPSGLGR